MCRSGARSHPLVTQLSTTGAIHLCLMWTPCAFSLLKTNSRPNMRKARFGGHFRPFHVGTAIRSLRRRRAQMARAGGASKGASDRASRQRPMEALLQGNRTGRTSRRDRCGLRQVCQYRRNRAANPRSTPGPRSCFPGSSRCSRHAGFSRGAGIGARRGVGAATKCCKLPRIMCYPQVSNRVAPAF